MEMLPKSKIKKFLIKKLHLKRTYPFRQYFDAHKCIFIHIPKAAGTSILSSLAEGSKFYRDHAHWGEFKKADVKAFNSYFKFTIVRNPFDRLVSYYTYMINGGNGSMDLEFSRILNENYETFDKFVLDYLSIERIYTNPMLVPQYVFTHSYTGENMIDYVGKMETIEQDLAYISSVLDHNIEVIHLNASKRKGYKAYYNTKAVRNKVSELYSKDIAIFDYSFDD